ncbi:hypothetical protein BJ138DRAFT_1118706 [Hygrophoropsis aurantiaca]|uniref:Uncharacterized protein n=1 Tax=Hygrophoropsis aurantiaca TaxID=72124 RepID=A0ACB7ZXU4_9AGAM|nr:hypothetical protein BJ138DRAFT_1118706 [Hygrophoropsis aurantiaca]
MSTCPLHNLEEELVKQLLTELPSRVEERPSPALSALLHHLTSHYPNITQSMPSSSPEPPAHFTTTSTSQVSAHRSTNTSSTSLATPAAPRKPKQSRADQSKDSDVCVRDGAKATGFDVEKRRRVESIDDNEAGEAENGESVDDGDAHESFDVNGTPPPYHLAAGRLLVQLAEISMDSAFARLKDLLVRLASDSSALFTINNDTSDLLSFAKDVKAFCAVGMVNDFYHMISLIRFAFGVSVATVRRKSYGALAKQLDMKKSTLYQWYVEGTRLIHLAAAATPYIILLIASMGLKTLVVRPQSVHSITHEAIASLAKVLRSPRDLGDPGLEHLTTGLVQRLRFIHSYEPLKGRLKYRIFSGFLSSSSCFLDFDDLQAADKLFQSFPANTWILPDRGEVWDPLFSPDSLLDISSEINPLSSPLAPIGIAERELDLIVSTLDLDKFRSPADIHDKNKKKVWTEAERLKAKDAVQVHSLSELADKVKQLESKDGSYIHISNVVIRQRDLKISDVNGKLIALAIGNTSPIIKHHLDHLFNLLCHLDPKFTSSTDSNTSKFTFKTFYFDHYNCFAESGEGAPTGVHADFIKKHGVSRVNHTQRIPYESNLIRQNPEKHQAILSVIEDICELISQALENYVPDIHHHLMAVCEVLPMNSQSASSPFPGFVLNLQVFTSAHVDAADDGICVVVPFGKYEGGELVLREPGLVFDLQQGDIFFFPSFAITRFNLHFKGFRGSIVFHADNQFKSWVENRNGWKNLIST